MIANIERHSHLANDMKKQAMFYRSFYIKTVSPDMPENERKRAMRKYETSLDKAFLEERATGWSNGFDAGEKSSVNRPVENNLDSLCTHSRHSNKEGVQ